MQKKVLEIKKSLKLNIFSFTKNLIIKYSAKYLKNKNAFFVTAKFLGQSSVI